MPYTKNDSSELRKSNLLWNEERVERPIERSIEQPMEQPIEQPLNTLTKRQLKRRRNKASKLSIKSKNLRIEIDYLKSQMGNIEDKIAQALVLGLNERRFVL